MEQINGPDKIRTGGELLADGLICQGADTVFGVPGESFLPLLDAIYARCDKLRFVTCRQEGGSAFMADAFGKLTGRPGICLVTRGPGACNASIGVHTAWQDSTPMIVLIGQVPRFNRYRDAFQEIEFRDMFAPMAKWICEVDSSRRIPEHLSHAFHIALSGRPGPVVLVLPEDVLAERAVAIDLPPAQISRAVMESDVQQRLHTRLTAARRPLVILGGPGWGSEAAAALARVAERQHIPVATALRCQDYFDNHHPCYGGDLGISAEPELLRHVRAADLLLVIGARLDEMTTQGYSVPSAPRSEQCLVHVYPDGQELGRVYYPDVPVLSDPALFAAALESLDAEVPAGRAAWCASVHQDYSKLLTPASQPGALDMGHVIAALQQRLPENTIVTNGAGNYTAWVHKFWRFRTYRSQLAPISGVMGYGVPASVAAKLIYPDRHVVVLAGDGCFLMNAQELATIRHYELDPLIVVVNNGMYGTIRMHQERKYPGRVYGTGLTNPDFAALATSFGLYGQVLERTEDVAATIDRALAAGGPALIDCRVDPEGVTPRTTLSDLAAAAQKSG